MKKTIQLIMAVAMLLGTTTTFAQEKKNTPTPEQRIEKRTEHMQRRLMLDDATAVKFAPIYKEYLKAKADNRPTCEKCTNPTDAQIKENIGKRLEAQKKAIEIEQKYYKKLSTILSGRQLQKIFCKDQKEYYKNHRKTFKGKQGKMKCPAKPNCSGAKNNCPKAQINCPNSQAK